MLTMSKNKLPSDRLWPRANSLFKPNLKKADIALVGVPAHKSSISPTSANLTPKAIRQALEKYSTFSGSKEIDLRGLSFTDLGDVLNPDGLDGKKRVAKKLENVLNSYQTLIALGGDNSITFSVASSIFKDLSKVGLVTLDAHHDLRDGMSNGSPVWRLIQAGLPGKNIVQIGISDFANSREYAERAKEQGIYIISRDQLRRQSMKDAMKEAFSVLNRRVDEIYVDLDVDVCDRAAVPACPASVPGGISADELRQAAFYAGANSKVRAVDITEIDVKKDSADQRTIRLAALLVLEFAAGVASR
jgi:formiminoglutamase